MLTAELTELARATGRIVQQAAARSQDRRKLEDLLQSFENWRDALLSMVTAYNCWAKCVNAKRDAACEIVILQDRRQVLQLRQQQLLSAVDAIPVVPTAESAQ